MRYPHADAFRAAFEALPRGQQRWVREKAQIEHMSLWQVMNEWDVPGTYGRDETVFSVDGSRCSFCHDRDRQAHRWPACRRVPRFSFVDCAGRVFWSCRLIADEASRSGG